MAYSQAGAAPRRYATALVLALVFLLPHFAAAGSARKLLQPGPVAASCASQVPAANQSTGDAPSPEGAASPAEAPQPNGGPAPEQGASPPPYQAPGLHDDLACATDETLLQLGYASLGDLLGPIPEGGTFLADFVSFLQLQLQQGVWAQVECRMEAATGQAVDDVDKAAWKNALRVYNNTVGMAYGLTNIPGNITFEGLSAFLDIEYEIPEMVAAMAGLAGNYYQQTQLLPLYTQWANLQIAIIRSALWGSLNAKFWDYDSTYAAQLESRLGEALPAHQQHVDAALASYEPPAGATNCDTMQSKIATHRTLHFAVVRVGRIFWDGAKQQSPPEVVDKTEIYSDPTGYAPSFPMTDGNTSFCTSWGQPAIPWPPVVPYHAANPDDKVFSMRVVANSRVDSIGVLYANASAWNDQGGAAEHNTVNDTFNAQNQVVKVVMLQRPFGFYFDDPRNPAYYLDGAYGMQLYFSDGSNRPVGSDSHQLDGYWGNHPVDTLQIEQVTQTETISYSGYILTSVYAPGPMDPQPNLDYQGALNFIFGWRRADSF